MSRWVERGAILGFGLALAILAALIVVSHRDIGTLIETTQRVAQTRDVLTELERILAALTEAETGVRGFVLTGDEQHLATYHTATATTLDQQVKRLDELTAGNPAQQELLDLLRRRITERLELLRETIDSRQRLGPEGAWKNLLARRGKERMDAFRRIVVAMQAAEHDLLRRRTTEQAASTKRMVSTLSVGGAVAFLVITLAYARVRRDLFRRRRAEEALQRTSTKLTGWVGTLDERGREISLLGEMGDLLQSCRAPEEMYGVIAQFAPQLFPGAPGMLGVLTASKNLVEVVATWGDGFIGDRIFPPKTCWALRRGRLHAVEDPDAGPLCGHLGTPVLTGYLCVAMTAQGEPFGVLHLRDAPLEPGAADVPKHVKESKRQLALGVAQHIALALANLGLRETLRRQAIRDPLTDLFNRRYMEESLDREIRRAARNKTPLGIIMLDIDHFKRFNDSYGHEAGDVLLRTVAGFLKTHVRGEDIACRYGGEEFTLILPGAPREVSTQRAEFLREGVKELLVTHDGQTLGPVTVSLGVAIFPDHAATGDGVLRAADAALYRAKQEGRNRVVIAG
ncbi:MAG: diguanylate cyclase [Candidatus Rokuibacteriota bacterium]